MQRYTPGALPRQNVSPNQQTGEDVRPLTGAERLCEFIRKEHGRTGVSRFLGALAPFVPRDFLEQLARRTGANAPPVAENNRERQQSQAQSGGQGAGMKPDQLLKLLNMTGSGGGGGESGGGMDPAMLIRLMSEMNR